MKTVSDKVVGHLLA